MLHFLLLQIFEEHDKTEAKDLKESSISALAKIKTNPRRIAAETIVLYCIIIVKRIILFNIIEK